MRLTNTATLTVPEARQAGTGDLLNDPAPEDDSRIFDRAIKVLRDAGMLPTCYTCWICRQSDIPRSAIHAVALSIDSSYDLGLLCDSCLDDSCLLDLAKDIRAAKERP